MKAWPPGSEAPPEPSGIPRDEGGAPVDTARLQQIAASTRPSTEVPPLPKKRNKKKVMAWLDRRQYDAPSQSGSGVREPSRRIRHESMTHLLMLVVMLLGKAILVLPLLVLWLAVFLQLLVSMLRGTNVAVHENWHTHSIRTSQGNRYPRCYEKGYTAPTLKQL